MGAVLIQGGVVVSMDPARTLIEDGFVEIEKDAIVAVGSMSELDGERGRDREAIDARGCIVIPGLINTHQHPWYGLFRGLGGGMLLEQWIGNLLKPTAEALSPKDLEVSNRLACAEMLATGTTTCLSHSVTRTDLDAVEATLRPVLESGMRQLFAKEIRPDPLDQELELAEEVHRNWDSEGGGRLKVGFVLESTAHWVAMGTSSEELILEGNELAARLGARISDHIAGGTMSREQGYLRFVVEMGRTDIEFLHALGVLDPKWILAHAINARDRDIGLIAESGASVAHTPTSEACRGGGITPVRRFREAGIPVHLGSDGPMVDTSVDMVEQMKAAIMFQNQLHLDPLSLTPQDALAMATCDAAAALGMDSMIGSLEVGKRADLAVFELDALNSAVWHDPVAALVQSLRGDSAREVLVDGKPLVRGGSLVDWDRAQLRELFQEGRACADEVLARARVSPANLRADRSALPTFV